MNVIPTHIAGLVALEPVAHADERGFFIETFKSRWQEQIGMGSEESFVQDNHSRSTRGVVRGLHFQVGSGVAKLVRCARGRVLDVAVELGFVKKAGAWFTYEGEQMGQGRENVKTFLRESPQLMAELDGRVREHLANALLPDVVGTNAEIDVDSPLTLD